MQNNGNRIHFSLKFQMNCFNCILYAQNTAEQSPQSRRLNSDMNMKRLSVQGKGGLFPPNLTTALTSINAKFFFHFVFGTLLPNLVRNIKFQKDGGNE